MNMEYLARNLLHSLTTPYLLSYMQMTHTLANGVAYREIATYKQIFDPVSCSSLVTAIIGSPS
jgi:hypothetical protein